MNLYMKQYNNIIISIICLHTNINLLNSAILFDFDMYKIQIKHKYNYICAKLIQFIIILIIFEQFFLNYHYFIYIFI